MKDPLTVKWFKDEVKPHVSKSAEYKNIENHVKSVENLEKKWRSAPLDPGVIKLLNNALDNVNKTMGMVKKPSNDLKAAMMKVSKAINNFKDDHNDKFVKKVTTNTIGSIPGGMKALAAVGVKEFTQENTAFRKVTGTMKKDATTLINIHKKFRDILNIPSSLKTKWDTARNDVIQTATELKAAAKAQDDEARKTLLANYQGYLDQLYKFTAEARQIVVLNQDEGIGFFKKQLVMK